MKIRNGYVSNSSSSSYIIEYKNIEQIIRIAGEELSVEDFFNLLYSNNDEDTDVLATTDNDEEIKDIVEYIDNQIKYANEENKEKLITIKNAINNNENNFAHIKISYKDKAVYFLFKLLCKYELITKRYSEAH